MFSLAGFAESHPQVDQFVGRTARHYLTTALVTTGSRVRPVCLPLFEEATPPESNCIIGGWGRVKESKWLSQIQTCMPPEHFDNLAMSLCCLPEGRPSPVLKEVQLDLVNPAKCRHVLQTVKASVFNQGPGRSQMTVLCAGPERGGKDACQVEKLSIYPSIHRSAIHPFSNLSIHLPFCREILGAHWCAQQGPVEATWWHLVLRPGVKVVVGVGVTTAVAIPPKEDPRVCSQMSGSCCLGSSKD